MMKGVGCCYLIPVPPAAAHIHLVGRPASSYRPSVVASFASLGFSADPRISIERAANNLLKDAASLLLYQEVLRVPPAQAFLKVLLALRRGDDGWKLLDAYGEFYKMMAVGQFLSWEDFILEGILAGEGNPFAEALASVGNPRSKWSKGVPPSLRAAAAADLDSLQRLCVTECTLVGWVTELVPDVRPEWRVAAESTLSSRDVKKSSQIEQSLSDSGELLSQSDSMTCPPKEALVLTNDVCDALASNREMWRRKIGGLWRWSEAVPVLEEYYGQYGVGKTACELAYHCKGGKLFRNASLLTQPDYCNLSVNKEHCGSLVKQFERHATGNATTSHVLVHGPDGAGKTSLVKLALHGFISQGRLRVVYMLKSEVKHMQGILEELAKNWQLRFVLVVDSLAITEDVTCSDWPENVMLCGICHSSPSQESTPSGILDEFEGLFGMVVTLGNLTLESYLLCVEEMLDYNSRKRSLMQGQASSREVQISQALVWAKQRNILSIRTAAQFVRSIL